MSQELEVLQSIYPELEFSEASRSGHLDLDVSFDTPKTVIFDTLPPFEVTYLPPLRLSFQLVQGYPDLCPPGIDLECSWLGPESLASLKGVCISLWDHEEVLYLVIDMLNTQVEADFADFGVTGSELHLADKLYPLISSHHQCADLASFQWKSYGCEICLEWRPGTACVTMDCGLHIFCKECLQGMFSLHIKEGSINLLRCPSCPIPKPQPNNEDFSSEQVPKRKELVRRIPVGLMMQIVSNEEVIRYQKLVRKQEIESMPNSTHCPRDFCATVLARDPDEKLVICTRCEYAFCADCMRGWHGPTGPCTQLRFTSELGELYQSLVNDPDAQRERVSLERLYGVKNLQRLLHELEDIKLADQWRLANAQSCPECKTYVEKSAGCNHMICQGGGGCGCHFCFLCGDSLSSRNPYAHYSDKGKSCYGKLFEGLTGLEEDPF